MAKYENPIEGALALLNKIGRGSLNPDSLALLEGAIELLNGILEPNQEPDPGDQNDSPDLEVEGAASTVDDVMEEELEEATEKALKEE